MPAMVKSTGFQQLMKGWPKYASVLCLSVSLMVLLGWAFDVELFKRPLAGLAAMNPVSALCFLLYSAALLLLRGEKNRNHYLCYVFVGVCIAINGYRVADEYFSFPLKADELVFGDKIRREAIAGMLNRMSFNGALNFLFACSSLLFLSSGKRNGIIISQTLAVIVGLIAWLGILGYVYRVPEFYGILSYLPMAVHTAVCFTLLSSALLFFHFERGIPGHLFASEQGGRLARFLMPIVLFVPFLLGYIRLILHWRNLISAEFGASVLIVSITSLFAALVFISVVLLNRNDRKRQQQERDLLQLNRALEQGNEEIATLNEELTSSNEELSSTNEELTMVIETLQLANDKIKEQAETIVKQKDEQLNQALESTDIIIWSVDRTGHGRNYISRSVERLTGIPGSEFIAQRNSWFRMVVPEDVSKRERALSELWEKGEVKDVFKFLDNKGTTRWFEIHIRIVRDDSGNPVREEGTAVDVTSLKQIESNLAREKNLLRSLIDNIPDYIFVKDQQLRYVINNAANNNLLGALGDRESLNKTSVDFFGEKGKAFQEDDQKILTTGESILNKEEHFVVHGSEKIVLTTKVPLKDPEGKISGIVGISRDITETRKQEQLLNQYRENLDIIFSSTIEEILLLDEEGKVVAFNNALEKFIEFSTGKKPEVGRYLWETTASERSEIARKLFNQALSGQSLISEAPIKTREGLKVHELRYQPVVVGDRIKYVLIISVDITERKEQERNIRKSEANLRAIFNTTLDSFILLDMEFTIRAFNESSRQSIFRWKAEELKEGMNILDLVPYESMDVFREFLLRAKAEENIEYETQTNINGMASWFQITISPVRDEYQQVIGLCITSHDLTSRKNAEMTMKENEERFRAIIENSEDFFVVARPDGELDYVSSNIDKVLGYSASEFMSRSFEPVSEMESKVYAIGFGEALHRPGELIPVSLCVKHKDRRRIWLEGTIINLVSVQAVKGLISTFRDVTAQRVKKRKIDQLNQSLSAFQEAINKSSIVSRADRRGDITFVNENFVAISGYSREELMGQNHRIVNSGYHPQSFWTDMWKTISRGEIWRNEVLNKAKDGSYYWVDTFIMPFVNEKNEVTEYLSIRHDVTHRKRAEHEKSDLMKQLVKQNNDLRQFSFIASHNLRGPVASIMGLVNLFTMEELPQDAAQLVTMLTHSVQRLDSVIRDLSLILEIRSDEMHAKERVQLSDVLNDIQTALESQINEAGARLIINAEEVKSFYTIKSYFHSILYNLISNAIKYRSPKRSPVIIIATFKTKEGVEIKIEDNGIGIDLEKFKDKVFMLYQRFHLEVEGKGLGLYMVRSQIQTLNGAIEIESEPDRGTAFTITFRDPEVIQLTG
jgi:PAS domain S-box-containing protein